MAVKIRLTRTGRHKDPFYRIVAADHKFARDGRYIEQIGFYDPNKEIKDAKIDEEIALKWLKDGASYSDTVKAILNAKGLIEKAKKEKKTNEKKKVTKTSCPKDEEKLKKEKEEKSKANKLAKEEKAKRLKEKEKKAKEVKKEETIAEENAQENIPQTQEETQENKGE